jgi:protein-S-isoprenylcysteine O-methyltransferase Ste14
MPEGSSARKRAEWMALYPLLGIALAAQLALLLLLPIGRIEGLVWVGWILFALSAVLGWVPIFGFRRRGRVPKGKSYVHTTQLVTSGLYAVVRHPQYLAWDFLAAAVMCITQHWGVIAAGAIGIAANHVSMIAAERDLLKKFGEAYREYTTCVPQWNLVVGIWRWAKRRTRRSAP